MSTNNWMYGVQQGISQIQLNQDITSGNTIQIQQQQIQAQIRDALSGYNYGLYGSALNIVSDEEMKFVEELRKTKLMRLAKL